MKDTVETHTTTASLDAHIDNIRAYLEAGDGHFLIGGVIDARGIKPVTFTRNLSDEARIAITEATPQVVLDLLLHPRSPLNNQEVAQ